MSSGPLRLTGAAVGLGALCALALLILLPRPAAAHTPPPESGDWEIRDNTTFSSTLVMMGSIIIYEDGTLNLRGGEIVFDCYERGEFRIEVKRGGALLADGVTFSASDPAKPYKFIINSGARAELRSCTIRNVGFFEANMTSWGIYVHSSEASFVDTTITDCNAGLLIHGQVSPTVSGCNVSGNADRGIWCRYSSPELRGCTISGNEWGIYIENSSSPRLLNNNIAGNRRGGVYVSPDSSAEWSVNTHTEWLGSSVSLRGNLTVEGGGALTLRSSSLQMLSSAGDRKRVLVRGGGELRLLEVSSLGAAKGFGAYGLCVESGGRLVVENSSIRDAGWEGGELADSGVCIRGSALIAGAELAGGPGALICDGANLSVHNTTLRGTVLDIWLARCALRLTNVSFRADRVHFNDSSSSMEVAWHLSVAAIWQSGAGVEGARVVIRDSRQLVLFDGPVGPDGRVRWVRAVQELLTRDGSTNLSAHTILGSRSGLEDVSRSVAVDRSMEVALVFTDGEPPEARILQPEDGSGTNSTTLVVKALCRDNQSNTIAELRLDGVLVWSDRASGEWSRELSGLADGEHVIELRAKDAAGLSSSSRASFFVDTEPPTLELEEPFEESLLVNRTGIVFRGTTERGCSLTINGEMTTVQASGAFETVVELGEGTHEVLVVARDRGGNTACVVRRIIVDLIPPTITILSPANGSVVRASEVALVGVVEPGARLTVDGSTVELSADGGFSHTVLLSGGTKTIELCARDAAGNVRIMEFVLERPIDAGGGQAGPLEGGRVLILAALTVIAILVAGVVLWAARRARKRGGGK